MHQPNFLFLLATAASLFHSTLAHPGHNVHQEIAEREAFFQHSPRDLSHCADLLRKRGTEDKNRERIQRAIQKARDDFGITKKKAEKARRATSPLNITHLSGLDVTPTTSGVEDIIFSNSSCVLSLEGDIGPFYVEGELIRTDIRETQPGVTMVIDAQFIDTTTCASINTLYMDVWSANSTGVYGGVSSSLDGNAADTTNIDKTFLRGLQPTDTDGVAQFTTIFPGHYSGRTAHIHVVAHEGGTVLSNNTYQGGNITHIGQLFWDQDLVDSVYALSPYTSDTGNITTNVEDSIVAAEIAGGSDPFFNYVLLGDTVDDGIFAWVTLGINQNAAYTASAAAELTADGGVPL